MGGSAGEGSSTGYEVGGSRDGVTRVESRKHRVIEGDDAVFVVVSADASHAVVAVWESEGGSGGGAGEDGGGFDRRVWDVGGRVGRGQPAAARAHGWRGSVRRREEVRARGGRAGGSRCGVQLLRASGEESEAAVRSRRAFVRERGGVRRGGEGAVDPGVRGELESRFAELLRPIGVVREAAVQARVLFAR